MTFVVVVISIVLATAGILEYRLHLSRLQKIPLRILVNGTRGKSTVTRLIAAGLAEAGIRTCAKTTGSEARIILPDLSEVPLRRRRGVSIMEHKWFVRQAVGRGAQAIVAECMAIQPETIITLESRLARSTIGVITNVRADHMDTMGTEKEQVAETLALSVPEHGKIFVGAEGMDEGLRAAFRRSEERRRILSARGHRKISLAEDRQQRGAEAQFIEADESMRALCERFAYPMFAENLALALAVCEECGVDREVAIRGMLKSMPDPGVRPSVEFEWRGMEVRVVNAFAANDTQSTLELWRRETADRDGTKNFRVLIFNYREDRAWRALQLEEISSAIRAEAICVFGMSEWLARRLLKKGEMAENFPTIRAFRASESNLEVVLEATMTMLEERTARIAILCAGNIKGPGAALTESIEAMRNAHGRRA